MDVEEMDEALVNNWNSTVSTDDAVYTLGDLVFHSDKHASYYIERLKKMDNELNEGVEINEYRPVTLADLIANNKRFKCNN